MGFLDISSTDGSVFFFSLVLLDFLLLCLGVHIKNKKTVLVVLVAPLNSNGMDL